MSRILGMMILLLLTGCFSSKTPIKVGSSMVLSSSGIFLAQELGYFAEEGLVVEIIPFKESGAPMTVLLSSGVLDIGGGNFSSGLFNSILEGSGVKVVADKGHISPTYNYISLIIRSDLLSSGKVKNISDLKGLKFGFTALNGVSQQVSLDKLLASHQLVIDDVHSFKYSYPMMNLALKHGDLDGAVQIEPYVTLAESEGIAQTLVKMNDAHPLQQSAGIFYSQKFMKERHDDAVKFMKAYLRGVRAYEAAFIKNINKGKIIALLKKYITIDSNQVWNKLTPVGLNPNGAVNWPKLKEDLRWYVTRKYLPKMLDREQVIDSTFVESALKKIGTAP